ncbi:MAG TPA: hypothetical protein VHB21_22395 [Minicystis sp.]|nr:hypothetical protein [Minicystis sp.]
MTLVALTLGLLTALAPPRGARDEARLATTADAISRAASSAPLWDGEAGRAATATLLVAIAFHESGLREDVQRCLVRGDRGRSLGLFQLMHDAAWSDADDARAICASDALQADLAVRALGRFRGICAACTPALWINGYASGELRRSTRASVEIAAIWFDLARRAGLDASPWRTKAPAWATGPDA